MSDLNGWKIAEVIGGLGVTILGWFGKREVQRVDTTLQGHAREIDDLQRDRVTRDDFDELRGSLTASIANGIEHLERNVEKRHQENREDQVELRRLLIEKLK